MLEVNLIRRGRPLTDSGPLLAGFTPFSRESFVEISDRDTVHGVKGVFGHVDPAFMITQGQTNLFEESPCLLRPS